MDQDGSRRHMPPGWAGPLLIVWVFAGAFIVYGTLIPFDFSAPAEVVDAKLRGFFERSFQGASRTDLVSNVLLFLPWGGLLGAWVARRRPNGPGLALAVVAATAGGVVLSVLVEMLQSLTPDRIPSWLDVAMNEAGAALGAAAGWGAAALVGQGGEAALAALARRRPLTALAIAAALVHALVALSPYDVNPDVGALKAAVKAARLVPFGPTIGGATLPAEPWSWAEEALNWSLLGGLTALALSEDAWARRRAVVLAATAALGLSAVIEAAQLLVAGRVTDMTSVVVAGAGATIGALAIAAAPGRSPRAWVVPALVVCVTALALQAWTPPQLVFAGGRGLSWKMAVPFLAYYRRTDIHAVADVVVQTLSYVPLGFLLAVRSPGASAWRIGALGLGLSLTLEAGQLFLENRTCDITDALTAAAGALVGAGLTRWPIASRSGVVADRERPVAR